MSKPRRKLSDLVQEETSKPKEQVENTDLQTTEVSDLQTSGVTKSVAPNSTDLQSHEEPHPSARQKNIQLQESTESTELQSLEVAEYLKLERKEARLRQNQIDALTDLTRSLNRKRVRKGERLTDNTLIRVAVDLLLSKASQIQGDTEEELRKSVGL